jgi:hypothetical protein
VPVRRLGSDDDLAAVGAVLGVDDDHVMAGTAVDHAAVPIAAEDVIVARAGGDTVST